MGHDADVTNCRGSCPCQEVYPDKEGCCPMGGMTSFSERENQSQHDRANFQKFMRGGQSPTFLRPAMGFLVTLAAGGRVHAFETTENFRPQLAKIFNIKEEDYHGRKHRGNRGNNKQTATIPPNERQETIKNKRRGVPEQTITTSLVKRGPLIGVTICDGGFGWAVVRDVRQHSDAYKVGIRVGDAIQSVNGDQLCGAGHFKTAQKLRSVPIDGAVAITLLRPKCAGFNNIGPRPKRGREARLEEYRKREAPTPLNLVNAIFEDYFGVHDNVLGELLIKLGKHCISAEDLKTTLETSPEVPPLEFTDENYQKLWMAISKDSLTHK